MLFEDAVLEPGTRALLKPLGEALAPEGFYLADGTALAIQCGHRRSIDLDFFTREAFDPDALLALLAGALSPQALLVTGRAAHTLNLAVSGVKVDAIRYDFPLLEPLVEAEGYAMLAPPDIAAMKLSAITNRGSRKDYYDLFILLERYPAGATAGLLPIEVPHPRCVLRAPKPRLFRRRGSGARSVAAP